MAEKRTLLDTAEVAARLGVSVAWVKRRRRHRLAPAYIRLGGTIRYDAREVERFVEEATVGPAEGEAA